MRSSGRFVFLLIAGLGLLATGAAGAEGDPERGRVLTNTCMGCHGIDGYRNAYPSYRVPRLGGQHPEYLVIALNGYKSQMRAHPTMQAQATSLSDQDMQDIAAFLASAGDARSGSATAESSNEKIAICTACHGEAGISPAPTWPNLAGQYRDYLVHSLKAYQNGERTDPIMSGQAAALSAEDIEELAAYYASQPGLFTASYTAD